MDLQAWINSLGTMLRETIIVAQFIVIVAQYRRGNAQSDAHTLALVELLKEARESEVEGVKSMHLLKSSIDLNSELLRRVDDSIRRRDK